MEQNGTLPVIDFTRYIADRTHGFSDRAWVFADLNAWLADADGTRFFLLSGEPGSGKTAIAARLVQFSTLGTLSLPENLTRFAPGFLSAYHFCSAHDRRWFNPQVFAESLALQLSARYPAFAKALPENSGDQRIQIEVEQNVQNISSGQVTGVIIKKLQVSSILPEDVFNRVVREPLGALFAEDPSVQVVILLDALDEALLYRGELGIVSLLAQAESLPIGVRFILTSRNDPRVIDQFKPMHRLDLSSPEYVYDTDTDIRRYVQQRMAEESMKQHVAAVESPAEIEDHLVKHAAGNFLYAAFLLDEVVDGKRSLANMADLPRGLYGLYRQFLDTLLPEMLQVNNSLRWVGEYQPLLGSLSVAMPAAPRDVLPAWIDKTVGQVWGLLNEVNQVTEYDPSDGGGDRLYHRSMAEFLALGEYQEDGGLRRNRYYTPPDEQHERIVSYYLTNFSDDWQDCDPYGLRQLVSHFQALLRQEKIPKKRSKLVEKLYSVVLDPKFQSAQRETLGDIYVTLIDLRTTLEIALARNDLVKALACIACYRDIKHNSRGISQAVFEAAQSGNFERALQRAAHYSVMPKPSGGWESIMRLYIAWEAAEQGKSEVAQRVIASIENPINFWSSKLAEAFLVRIAHALVRQTPDSGDANTWLNQWNLGRNPENLVKAYGLAQVSKPTQGQVAEMQRRLANFQYLIAEGDPMGTDVAPLLDEEVVGKETAGLRELLVELAAQEAGQNGIDQALDLVLPDPYPRYRDIGLEALGIACLAVPEPSWARTRLQSLLRAALDREGVTFTFDLPAILLAEAGKRGLLAQDLAEYLEQALNSDDRWGTPMHAHSARAAALFWQGRTEDAVSEWETATKLPSSGFAGYAVVTLLSLANRWVEFGFSSSPTVENLVNQAEWNAGRVLEPSFQKERTKLVELYRKWTMENTPDIETVQSTLSATPDPETRKAYKDLISARWAGQANPNLEGLKALLPETLADGTTLDMLLGRLFGLTIKKLNNSDLTEAIRLCATHFMSSRTWELGQWR